MGNRLFGAADNKKNTPTKLPLSDVNNVSLSCIHILALTRNDGVYAWGYNRLGECGVASNSGHIETPAPVFIPDDHIVDDILAGRDHSIIKFSPKK